MLMLTWWLSIASGGTAFSLGISRPRAWAGAAAASSSRAGNKRRMGHPFHLWGGDVLRPLDEAARGLDCGRRACSQIREQVGDLADEPRHDVLAAQVVAFFQRRSATLAVDVD